MHPLIEMDLMRAIYRDRVRVAEGRRRLKEARRASEAPVEAIVIRKAARADARAREVVACLGDAIGIALEGEDPAPAELLRDVKGRVADGRPELQHRRRVERADEGSQQAPRLPVDDRDAVALGHRLHLAHHLRALGA